MQTQVWQNSCLIGRLKTTLNKCVRILGAGNLKTLKGLINTGFTERS
ncbi:hypothetical protein SPONN_2491 [uncultured Candidatus Thioglobus sp.]|nr:hypothetical protein SPONN_2491 [uncultured Candidatus Thioglobus sp.]